MAKPGKGKRFQNNRNINGGSQGKNGQNVNRMPKEITSKANLKELYKKLDKMSDGERAERISEIKEQMEALAHENLEKVMAKQELELAGEEISKGMEQEIKDLARRGLELKKEKETLESFPSVKDKLEKIANLQEEYIKRKEANIAAAKEEVHNAEIARIKVQEEMEEIDKKIEDYQKALILLGDDIPVATKAAEDKIAELESQLANMGEKEEEAFEKAKKNLEYATSGKTKEDKVINQCKMPWECLLAGKEWKEISLMSTKELYEKLDILSEYQPEEEEKREDKGKQAPQEKGQKKPKQNNRGYGYGPAPAVPAPIPEPEKDPEQQPEEKKIEEENTKGEEDLEEQKEELEDFKKQSWIAKFFSGIISKISPKRRETLEKRIKRFKEIEGREPSKKEMRKLKHPIITKFFMNMKLNEQLEIEYSSAEKVIQQEREEREEQEKFYLQTEKDIIEREKQRNKKIKKEILNTKEEEEDAALAAEMRDMEEERELKVKSGSKLFSKSDKEKRTRCTPKSNESIWWRGSRL